ncbi:succinylglutamate desuccinylase/aspartoacylase domain-containing protein [Aestuariivirga sp. YIM B02566]|uniref:Succinylglutamate desuccinylase/aspartoacylase family protein n=1 Tax=Taklimakanibacter albus TaxID=2800327 RepID=A0ACC5RB43_9HYPH|nr:succinylglutamate desuccinylase/aspartoacylase family protein [Aestuariivirga sp. YIM B02566]MBK1869824.1 succinylglutamate desuccinylase/aspartoacylase family protein [Aestuariivirga sp. YIM B02566]
MHATIDIDLDAAGRQSGSLSLPALLPDGEERRITTPIHCLAQGEGPTLVLTAGVHGDEYEGPIALAELARGLDPGSIRGRIIILPRVNAPACDAGVRSTPIDGLNLNRAFPGRADGPFTSRLAHVIETELYARADYAADFHCGGAILHFLPSTLFVVTGDEQEDRRRLDLARGFGARHCMLFGAKTMGVEVSIDAAMLRQDVIGISGEFGGSAEVTPAAMDLCRTGLKRLLGHLGITPPQAPSEPIEPQLVDVRPDECYVLAEMEGLFEPLVQLGDDIAAGALVGRLHRHDREPLPVRARTGGVVMARRSLARSATGDWLYIIGRPVASL